MNRHRDIRRGAACYKPCLGVTRFKRGGCTAGLKHPRGAARLGVSRFKHSAGLTHRLGTARCKPRFGIVRFKRCGGGAGGAGLMTLLTR